MSLGAQVAEQRQQRRAVAQHGGGLPDQLVGRVFRIVDDQRRHDSGIEVRIEQRIGTHERPDQVVCSTSTALAAAHANR